MGADELHDEMLAAFLAIEAHDAHVVARREHLAGEQREVVATSVAIQRRMFGATGEVSEAVSEPRVSGSRRVADPMLTDAEYYHKRGQRPTDPHVGKVWVAENSITRLGALCFIRPPRRQEHHEIAAERFKSLYEERYGLGNPSMDPGRVLVDTSPKAHDSGMAGKIDRTWLLQLAEERLGPAAFNRLVALLVLEIPAGEGETHWRRRKDSVDLVLADLDNLAAIWRYGRKAA